MTSFGIMTAQQQVGYDDVLRVWQEADAIPEIEHAWLFDHLLPIGGDPDGPVLEGWTLLSALAAQTDRLRLGLLVTSNRFRSPAVLAKIAATVDIVSRGRLDLGIGVGSRPNPPGAWREYPAHGLPFAPFADAVRSLDEACTVIRRLWTESEPFDFDGEHVQLRGALGNPKPVQRPHPPFVIGGRTPATLRVVARHADVWNVPGADLDDALRRSALLDGFCAELGRDPAEITRSIHLSVAYDRPERTREAIARAQEGGFGHVVLGLGSPFPTALRGGSPTSSCARRPRADSTDVRSSGAGRWPMRSAMTLSQPSFLDLLRTSIEAGHYRVDEGAVADALLARPGMRSSLERAAAAAPQLARCS